MTQTVLTRQNQSIPSLLAQVVRLTSDGQFSAAKQVLEKNRPDNSPDEYRWDWGYWLAFSCFKLGEYSEALEKANICLEELRVTADHGRLARIQYLIGDTYLALGDLKNAELYLRDSASTYRRIEDHPGLGQAFNELARVAFIRGDFPRAIEALEDALTEAQRSNDEFQRAKILGNLGRVYIQMGHWEKAEKSLTLALLLNEHLEMSASRCRNYLSLGYLNLLRGELAQATDYLDQARVLINEPGLIREQAILGEYQGDLAVLSGDYITAEKEYLEAQQIGEKIAPNSSIISQVCRRKAELFFARQRYSEAEQAAQRALEVGVGLGEKSEVGSTYRVFGQIAGARQEMTKARAYFDHALQILEEVGDLFEIAKTGVAALEFAALQSQQIETAWIQKYYEKTRNVLQTLNIPYLISALESNYCRILIRKNSLSQAQELLRNLSGLNLTDRSRVDQLKKELDDQIVTESLSAQNSYRFFTPRPGEIWFKNVPPPKTTLSDFVLTLKTKLFVDLALVFGIDQNAQFYQFAVSDQNPGSNGGVSTDGTSPGCNLNGKPTGCSQIEVAHQTLIPILINTYQSLFGVPGFGDTVKQKTPIPVAQLIIPLFSDQERVGALYLARTADGHKPLPFSLEDVSFAIACADLLAFKVLEERHRRLLADNRRLRRELQAQSTFPNIITQDSRMLEILRRAEQVKDSTISILLEGETGVGKDLLAKAIHYHSVRKDQPFVSVNCAALPETLLESELFGHKKGAFTGADRDKIGLFVEADGGTFYLDEVAEVPATVQVKLLRVLEDKEVTRLGDTKPRKVDVRVISAGNSDLKAKMEKGLFRQDLYYRLCPLTFKLSPLRERKEDIPLLIDYFLKKYTTVVAGSLPADQSEPLYIESAALRLLLEYDWPGNVRELENEIRKLVLLAGEKRRITAELLSKKYFGSESEITGDHSTTRNGFSLYDYISQFEKKHILKALSENNWIKKRAAEALQIPESTLRLKMKQYGLTVARD